MLIEHAQQIEQQHVPEPLYEHPELFRDPPCDPVCHDEIDILFVRFRHTLCSAAGPESDDDALAKAVFRHGERLVEHTHYIVLLVTKSISQHHDNDHDDEHAQHPSKAFVQRIVACLKVLQVYLLVEGHLIEV